MLQKFFWTVIVSLFPTNQSLVLQEENYRLFIVVYHQGKDEAMQNLSHAKQAYT